MSATAMDHPEHISLKAQSILGISAQPSRQPSPYGRRDYAAARSSPSLSSRAGYNDAAEFNPNLSGHPALKPTKSRKRPSAIVSRAKAIAGSIRSTASSVRPTPQHTTFATPVPSLPATSYQSRRGSWSDVPKSAHSEAYSGYGTQASTIGYDGVDDDWNPQASVINATTPLPPIGGQPPPSVADRSLRNMKNLQIQQLKAAAVDQAPRSPVLSISQLKRDSMISILPLPSNGPSPLEPRPLDHLRKMASLESARKAASPVPYRGYNTAQRVEPQARHGPSSRAREWFDRGSEDTERAGSEAMSTVPASASDTREFERFAEQEYKQSKRQTVILNPERPRAGTTGSMHLEVPPTPSTITSGPPSRQQWRNGYDHGTKMSMSISGGQSVLSLSDSDDSDAEQQQGQHPMFSADNTRNADTHSIRSAQTRRSVGPSIAQHLEYHILDHTKPPITSPALAQFTDVERDAESAAPQTPPLPTADDPNVRHSWQSFEPTLLPAPLTRAKSQSSSNKSEHHTSSNASEPFTPTEENCLYPLGPYSPNQRIMAVTPEEAELLSSMRRKRAAMQKQLFTDGYKTAIAEELRKLQNLQGKALWQLEAAALDAETLASTVDELSVKDTANAFPIPPPVPPVPVHISKKTRSKGSGSKSSKSSKSQGSRDTVQLEDPPKSAMKGSRKAHGRQQDSVTSTDEVRSSSPPGVQVHDFAHFPNEHISSPASAPVALASHPSVSRERVYIAPDDSPVQKVSDAIHEAVPAEAVIALPARGTETPLAVVVDELPAHPEQATVISPDTPIITLNDDSAPVEDVPQRDSGEVVCDDLEDEIFGEAELPDSLQSILDDADSEEKAEESQTHPSDDAETGTDDEGLPDSLQAILREHAPSEPLAEQTAPDVLPSPARLSTDTAAGAQENGLQITLSPANMTPRSPSPESVVLAPVGIKELYDPIATDDFSHVEPAQEVEVFSATEAKCTSFEDQPTSKPASKASVDDFTVPSHVVVPIADADPPELVDRTENVAVPEAAQPSVEASAPNPTEPLTETPHQQRNSKTEDKQPPASIETPAKPLPNMSKILHEPISRDFVDQSKPAQQEPGVIFSDDNSSDEEEFSSDEAYASARRREPSVDVDALPSLSDLDVTSHRDSIATTILEDDSIYDATRDSYIGRRRELQRSSEESQRNMDEPELLPALKTLLPVQDEIEQRLLEKTPIDARPSVYDRWYEEPSTGSPPSEMSSEAETERCATEILRRQPERQPASQSKASSVNGSRRGYARDYDTPSTPAATPKSVDVTSTGHSSYGHYRDSSEESIGNDSRLGAASNNRTKHSRIPVAATAHSRARSNSSNAPPSSPPEGSQVPAIPSTVNEDADMLPVFPTKEARRPVPSPFTLNRPSKPPSVTAPSPPHTTGKLKIPTIFTNADSLASSPASRGPLSAPVNSPRSYARRRDFSLANANSSPLSAGGNGRTTPTAWSPGPGAPVSSLRRWGESNGIGSAAGRTGNQAFGVNGYRSASAQHTAATSRERIIVNANTP